MSGMDRLTELLPCPFCGDNHSTTTYTRDGRLVVCTSCGAKSGNYYHGPKDLPSADERAIAAWNRRASQAAPAPSDGLREAVETIVNTHGFLTDLGYILGKQNGNYRRAWASAVVRREMIKLAQQYADDGIQATTPAPAQEGDRLYSVNDGMGTTTKEPRHD